MKRIQLYEFEDFPWFPTMWRSTMTKIIVVFHKLLGTAEVLGELLIQIRKRHSFTQIVDMGSGSGGAMPMAVEYLQAQTPDVPTSLLLTDLHPNPTFVEAFNQSQRSGMTYSATSLDATNLSEAPEGLKTMINSFHHMPPPIAQKILATAQANKQPILIQEMTENNIPTLAWVLTLPLSLPLVALTSMVFVPFVKPLNWKDLLFTWLIPVIPIFYAWDGQASMPRMYTFEDIKKYLLPEPDAHYTWEIAQAQKKDGKKRGYYILGLPESPDI
ncbi:MAG: hypothetical protein AAFQ92_09310 [Bacteroidota bacterium]